MYGQLLSAGDHVQVARRAGSGVEHWYGVVVDVNQARGTASIVGSRRRVEVPLRGAMWLRVLVDGEAWEAFVDAHAWTAPQPAIA